MESSLAVVAGFSVASTVKLILDVLPQTVFKPDQLRDGYHFADSSVSSPAFCIQQPSQAVVLVG